MTKNDWRMRVARKGLFVNGKTIIWWPKLLIPRMLKTLWSPQKKFASHRCSVTRMSSVKSRFSLDRTFPDGVLVRSSSGKSIAFSALEPIHPGCCLFVSFEVRFETKREWLAFKQIWWIHFYFVVLHRNALQESMGRHQGLNFTSQRCMTLAHCRPTRTDYLGRSTQFKRSAFWCLGLSA